jgi:hypothetical protein
MHVIPFGKLCRQTRYARARTLFIFYQTRVRSPNRPTLSVNQSPAGAVRELGRSLRRSVGCFEEFSEAQKSFLASSVSGVGCSLGHAMQPSVCDTHGSLASATHCWHTSSTGASRTYFYSPRRFRSVRRQIEAKLSLFLNAKRRFPLAPEPFAVPPRAN